MRKSVPEMTATAHRSENLLSQLSALARRRSALLSEEPKLWAELAQLLSDAATTSLRSDPNPIQPQTAPDNLSRRKLLSAADAAEFLGMAGATLARWRLTGEGPEFVKVGNRIFYRRPALEQYVSERTFPHTSAYALRKKG
jgi:hypothetical protein